MDFAAPTLGGVVKAVLLPYLLYDFVCLDNSKLVFDTYFDLNELLLQKYYQGDNVNNRFSCIYIFT